MASDSDLDLTPNLSVSTSTKDNVDFSAIIDLQKRLQIISTAIIQHDYQVALFEVIKFMNALKECVLPPAFM